METIQYAYKYYDTLGFHTVRRLDGLALDHIPVGLVKIMKLDVKNEVKNEPVVICYTSDFLNAIVDFRGKYYSQDEVDEIISDIEKLELEEANRQPKRVLFNKKNK